MFWSIGQIGMELEPKRVVWVVHNGKGRSLYAGKQRGG